MHKYDWDDIRCFLEVSRASSLTEAAEVLAVNQTTVSRRVSDLESRLGVKLFHRGTRGWTLTSAGEAIQRSCEEMEASARAVERLATSNSQYLSGRLRVSADACMHPVLVPIVAQFAKTYPAIELDYWTADAGTRDPNRADVSVRGTNSPPENLLGKRVCDMNFAVYATPELQGSALAGEAVPAVIYGGDTTPKPDWLRAGFPNAQVAHRTESVMLMRDLIAMGTGIGCLGCFLGDATPGLERVETTQPLDRLGVWVLSQEDLRTTARVRLFRDHVFGALLQQEAAFVGS